jgi:diacylglycerol kinase (ATP)
VPAGLTVLRSRRAGPVRARRGGDEAIRRLRASGADVRVLDTATVEEARAGALAAVAAGTGGLVAIGGDGCVHLAVNAVAGTGTPVGIVPTGTGNDIARALGVPSDPGAAADAVLRGVTTRVDAVRTDLGWYAGVLCAGFDARVNARANSMRQPPGTVRYLAAVLAELRGFSPLRYDLELDGERSSTDAMLVAVGNTSSYGGGMRICARARPDDGLLDVVIVHPLSRLRMLTVLPRVYGGSHLRHPAVEVRRVRTVSIATPGITAYADGEPLGPLAPRPLRCEVVPGALRVLVGGPT